MADVIRTGVIGTGIGVAHIEALRQVADVEVTAVCSAQIARAEAVAARFNIPVATADYRELLDLDIDAVIIATPPALHAEQGLAAIAVGKHVLCEKPLAASVAEARALRDAADAAGVVHMLNHQLRFAPAYARIAELIREDYLGQVAVADARITMNPVDYLRSPAWSVSKANWFTDARQGGGLIAGSAGPHLVDLLLWYGGPIVAVAAQAAVTRPAIALDNGAEVRNITAEDAFVVLARFTNGGLATIRGVPVAYRGSGFAVDLHGINGTLAIEGGALRGATATDDALTTIDLPGDAPQDRVRIASCFIDAIRAGGRSPAPNFDDGVAVQAVLAAIVEATRTDRWIEVERT